MVRHYAPLLVMVIALCTVVFSLFGEDSYSRLGGLHKAAERQELENEKLRTMLVDLNEKVTSLRYDPRALEKAARSELGLARPNEQIFIFDKKSRDTSS